MESQSAEPSSSRIQEGEASMYTCIVNLGFNWVDVSIYDKDGKLVKYEKLEHGIRSIEIVGKYFRLSRSEFCKEEVVIVSQISKGTIEVLEKVIRIS